MTKKDKRPCAFAILPVKSAISRLYSTEYRYRCFSGHLTDTLKTKTLKKRAKCASHSSRYPMWLYTMFITVLKSLLSTWYTQYGLATRKTKERRYDIINLTEVPQLQNSWYRNRVSVKIIYQASLKSNLQVTPKCTKYKMLCEIIFTTKCALPNYYYARTNRLFTVVIVMYSLPTERPPRMCDHVSINGNIPIEIHCKRPPADGDRGHPFTFMFSLWSCHLSGHKRSVSRFSSEMAS